MASNIMWADEQKQRSKDQGKTERKATGRSIKKQTRTQLCLSVTEADKRKLQVYCAEHGITVANLIHQWIEEHSL